jgi:hypothetical protein
VLVVLAIFTLIGLAILHFMKKRVKADAYKGGVKEGMKYGNDMGDLNSLENGYKNNDKVPVMAGQAQSDLWGKYMGDEDEQ